MTRRAMRWLFAALLGFAWSSSVPASDEGVALRAWLVGSWQSDRERTMERFSFQGRVLGPEYQERMAALFGHMQYRVTPQRFGVMDRGAGWHAAYTVVSETESTITLRFPGRKCLPDITLYRDGDDALFIKTGNNLEYFRRTGAEPPSLQGLPLNSSCDVGAPSRNSSR